VITKLQGDAYPWTADPVLAQAAGPCFRHHYSMNYERFPPPCFPVPSNLWVDVSWTEIFESRNPIASYLPN
jgi:hypothetical protein